MSTTYYNALLTRSKQIYVLIQTMTFLVDVHTALPWYYIHLSYTRSSYQIDYVLAFDMNEQTFIRVRVCVFKKRGFSFRMFFFYNSFFLFYILLFFFSFSSSILFTISFLLIKRKKNEAQKSTHNRIANNGIIWKENGL